MKKYSIAVIFSLLLILLLSPAAFAENIIIFDAPGPISAGQQLHHLVASVPSGSSVDAGSIDGDPDADWLSIESTPAEDGRDNLYISGSTLSAGTYTYFINVHSPDGSNNTISCTVSVVPAVPQVTMNSSTVECYVGDNVQLSISSSVNDGGTLSYQWYSNASNSNSGGIPIELGTSGSISVNTSIEGTTYYYCEVTNTNNSLTAVVVSSPCSVTVRGAQVASISIANLPNVTNYKVGDSLNTSGLQISLNFSDGSSRIVSEGFSVSPMVLSTPGTQSIEVLYGDKTCSFSVNVEEVDEVIEGIGVLTMPDKTEYMVGEDLQPRGLSIRVYTNHGQRDVMASELELSPIKLETAGSQTITVTYGGKTCTFNVTVKAEEKPISLSVLSKPHKLNYAVGEDLDSTGLTLQQSMSSGKKETVTAGFTCSPVKFTKPGPQTVTVTYGNFTCSFSVNVTEKEAVPSPTVSPDSSTAPTASPEATPHISQHESHKTGGHTALIVIMVVAILALIGLGVYAYMMSRNGEDNFMANISERIKDFFDSIKKDR